VLDVVGEIVELEERDGEGVREGEDEIQMVDEGDKVGEVVGESDTVNVGERLRLLVTVPVELREGEEETEYVGEGEELRDRVVEAERVTVLELESEGVGVKEGLGVEEREGVREREIDVVPEVVPCCLTTPPTSTPIPELPVGQGVGVVDKVVLIVGDIVIVGAREEERNVEGECVGEAVSVGEPVWVSVTVMDNEVVGERDGVRVLHEEGESVEVRQRVGEGEIVLVDEGDMECVEEGQSEVDLVGVIVEEREGERVEEREF